MVNKNQNQQPTRERAPRRREVVESDLEHSSQDEALEDQSKEEEQPRRSNNNQRWNQEPK